MTNSNNSQFLAIEKTATDLVNQLQDLAKVVQSYNQVNSDLKQASQGLFTATTQYTNVATQVGEVAITMRQVGMPQLLDAVERARQETSSNLVQLLSAIEQAQQSVSTGHDNLLASVKEATEQVLSQQAAIYHAVLSLANQQQRDAAQTKRLVIVGAVFATAAGVTAAVLPLFNLTL